MIDGKFDSRSLALFRITLGLLVLSQSILLARDFAAFYQPSGVFPSGSSDASRFPLLPAEIVASLVHVLVSGVIPLFAIALIAGLLTRLATLGCFICLIVVQGANPQILQGGDVLLRLLLFWSLFLPLGQKWSVDARYRIVPPLISLPWTNALATWALTLQICFVYWFAALLKSDPLWTQNGNALFYALNIEHFTTPLGLYLRQFPDFLRVLTFGTLCLEFIGPCLLFIPFRHDTFRLVAVVLFMGFHLIGMQALLRIGLFPWVCAVAWLVFLPGSFWDWFTARKDRSPKIKKAKNKQVSDMRGENDRDVRKWPAVDYLCAVLITVSLLDVLAWNVASVSGKGTMEWMSSHDIGGSTLRLDQRWNMYAPYPRSEHGWLIVPADLANGTEVDLFTGQPVSWDKPEDIGAYFGDDRWHRYLSNLFDDRDPQALQAYADYLVRNWNQSHGQAEKVQVVTIYFMKQVTQPDLTITSPEKEALYFHAY